MAHTGAMRYRIINLELDELCATAGTNQMQNVYSPQVVALPVSVMMPLVPPLVVVVLVLVLTLYAFALLLAVTSDSLTGLGNSGLGGCTASCRNGH